MADEQCRSRFCTWVLEKVAVEGSFVSERRGDELGQHGEVCGAVGTRRQRVERVEASSPHRALVRNQIRGRVLIQERDF